MILEACFECGRPSEYEHHVVPRSLGGTKTVPLCGLCHAKIHELKTINTRELTRRALQQKRQRRELTGQLPYGFKINTEGRLEINYDEVKIIRRMLGLRSQNKTLRAISSILIQEGMLPRNGRDSWSPQQINSLTQRWARQDQ